MPLHDHHRFSDENGRENVKIDLDLSDRNSRAVSQSQSSTRLRNELMKGDKQPRRATWSSQQEMRPLMSFAIEEIDEMRHDPALSAVSSSMM